MIKYYISILLIYAMSCINGQINTGSPSKPFNSNTGYPFGIMPTNLPSGGTYGKSNDAANAYTAWKTNFVRNCSPNGSRVLFDDNSSTVSEGIAYGMLLSAYAGDKPLFDDLWRFYKANTNNNGVMNWKLSGCSGVTGQNGATDAELDAALALLVAADQWPTATSPYNYKNEATSLISKIRQFEIHPNSYQTLNGDAWGSGNDCRNPSYFAPAYYREFAKVENAQATFWNNTVNASNTFLLANRNATTGLVSNWAGSNASPNNCNGPNEYGFDACRNPWRMANDVLWNGTSTASAAADICNKVASWSTGHAGNLRGPLPMNASNPSVGQYRNGTFTTYALAAMVSSTHQNHLNSCYTNVVGIGNENIYFNATMRAISLFMMTGNFWKPGSNIVTAVVTITAPTANAVFNLGAPVSITATATVSSGSISKVEFYDGTTLIGTDNSAPYEFSTSSLSAGSHTIIAKSYDASNTLLATSAGISITIKSPSDITTTGIVDMFESATPVSKLTGGFNTASCSGIATAATAGINWFEDRDAATPFKAQATRADGKLTYLLSQAAGAYNAIGFNFGEYCSAGVKTKYALDLRQNAVLKMTVSAPATNTASLELKIQVKDADGTVLAFNKNFVNAVSTDWYKYELGFNKNHVTPDYPSLTKGYSANFEFDLKNALTVKDPEVSNAANINLNNTDFDFSKVVEVLFLVVNSADNGAPAYAPLAFTDQTLVFSNVTLGNASAGVDICTTPAAPVAGATTATCQGATASALTATGTTGLALQWYGTSSTGGTASTTATVPSTTTAGPATYYVSQKVGTGTCEGPRTPIAFTVNPSVTPAVAITSVPAGSISAGTSVTFNTNVTSGGTIPTYQWRKNTVNIDGATSASYTSATLVNNDKIDVVVTSNAACANPLTATSNQVVMSVVTSVDDVVFQGMELYPNPVQNQLTVNGLSGSFDYQLLDNSGKVVTSGSSQGSLNLEEVSAGFYTLIVKIEGKQKMVKLLKN